jgi:uncharacterized protein with FMN-binding domain
MMRRITLWMLSTVAVVVLLFSYRTSTSGPTVAAAAAGAQPPGVVVAAPSSPTSESPSASANTTGKPKSPTATATATATSTVSVNGSVAQTRWGPVQVQVHIIESKITDVVALVYPSGNGHDQEINSYALPQLRQEVLSAQSAQISGVSGATVTSDGYRESLQAALDAAHFHG